ncbi:arylamine N-acetyltransferase [Streptomyces venezuelae]|uniref:Arylamine N-acetyltransferase n=1 Tax=Streptomyces venezuelae TaxID=54571 RepID=A0A5P2D3Y6_STRVZ|nr:arylamine N-acetyltransferase [Streptomyces venezuelae]QES49453.1 arylamine N-acetyltransferase [Streptomyces venezuelae]
MISGISAGYLRRLGISDPGTPSAEALFALQRAHLERIPYENIDIQLGRPPGIDPELSARRIAAGRGGYCFHLNGAFAALLESLGYEVTRHVGGVYEDLDAREVNGNHMALVVRVDGTPYFVDAGLGDGPYDPLPLLEGSYEQGEFGYRMEPLTGPDGPGWSLQSAGGPFPVTNFRAAPSVIADFEAEHLRLSTAEDSSFVRTLTLLRRDAEGIDLLRGRVLTRIDGAKGPSETELTGAEEFYDAIATVFGRELDDLTADDRAALWTKVTRAHEAWLTEQAAKA